jgi:fibronectin type 3 domain-containing protein
VAEISWSPNTEADLAGYNVYRGTVKLNDKPIANTVYRDLAPGASPRYTVTAVDTHNNESPHSQEVRP